MQRRTEVLRDEVLCTDGVDVLIDRLTQRVQELEERPGFGLVAGVLIGLITEYYTSTHTRPVAGIVEQSTTGSATNIIAGLGVGMYSTGLPAIVLSIAIIGAFKFAGLYGIAIAAVGMP